MGSVIAANHYVIGRKSASHRRSGDEI